MIEEKYGFIDKYGVLKIPAVYDEFVLDCNATIGSYCGNERIDSRLEPPIITTKLILIKLNGLYGFIDNEGKTIIQAIFNKAENFNNGKAKVSKNGIEYYIDENGNEIK